MEDLLEFLEDSPRGFAYAAAKHMMLKAVLVLHCSAPHSVNAWAQAVVLSPQDQVWSPGSTEAV